MKCACKSCGGSGEICRPCDDCSGQGEVEIRLENVGLDKSLDHYDALLELQGDAVRVQIQTTRLIEMKPDHAAFYRAQCAATLDVINEQAEALVKGGRL